MHSDATTVEQYLAELPEERTATIEFVRKVILENLVTSKDKIEATIINRYQINYSFSSLTGVIGSFLRLSMK